jgi:hypothetical protein
MSWWVISVGGIRLLIPCEDAQTVVGSSKCNSRMVTTDISFSWTANQSLTHRGTGMARDERYEPVSPVAVS